MSAVIREIEISRIYPDPGQPRKEFPPEELAAIARSIEAFGQKVPIMISGFDGEFVIIDGERRWRACKMLGMTTVSAIVNNKLSDRYGSQITINFCRQDHTPKEITEIIKRLRSSGNTIEQICLMFGKSKTWVANYCQFEWLHTDVIETVSRGKRGPRDDGGIRPSVARHLSKLPRSEQVRVAKQIGGMPYGKAVGIVKANLTTDLRSYRIEKAEKISKVVIDGFEEINGMSDEDFLDVCKKTQDKRLAALHGRLHFAAQAMVDVATKITEARKSI